MSARTVPVRTSAVGLILLSAVAGFALVPKLPAEMAIHFSAAGTPDNYVPSPVGVAVIPVTMAVTYGVLRGAARIDQPDDRRTYAVTVVATMLFLAGLQAFLLAWNPGDPVPAGTPLVGAAVFAAGVLGYSRWRRSTTA